MAAYVNGVMVAWSGANNNYYVFWQFSFIVPPGGSYYLSPNGSANLATWSELR